jgi:hypothetical protein
LKGFGLRNKRAGAFLIFRSRRTAWAFVMGVLERQLQRYATLADEVTACGGVVAYVLRPGVPGWAYAYITTMANGAACLCCKQQPCGEPVAIINVQAAADATLILPLPVSMDCNNLAQVRAALDCACMDLFPRPVRLQLMAYEGEKS